MKVLKPGKLQKGDLIGLITPASSPKDLSRVERGRAYLEARGYRTVLGKNACKYYGYLGGTDKERTEDIHSLFSNTEVRAIFSLRGGYGSGRLLPSLDYELIASNPKIFVGYSDITTLQNAFVKKTGLVSFAGPMPAVDFHMDVSEYTANHFWDIVESGGKGLIPIPENHSLICNNKSAVSGKLTGGNLALLISILGSEYTPSFENKILFIEDTGEPPYRVDRMLNQLKIANILNKVAGVIVGQFTDAELANPDDPTLTMNEVFENYLGGLDKPIIYNFPHGHVKQTATMAFNIEVEMNSNTGTVEYLEESCL